MDKLTNTGTPSVAKRDAGNDQISDSAAADPIYSLWQLILYALRLGTFGFGFGHSGIAVEIQKAS